MHLKVATGWTSAELPSFSLLLKRHTHRLSFATSFASSSQRSTGLDLERSPFRLFSWQSQKGVWMGCPWELDCVGSGLVFMHSRGWAEPLGPFLLPVISFGLPYPFYLTGELGLLTLPIPALFPSPLTHKLIHFQSEGLVTMQDRLSLKSVLSRRHGSIVSCVRDTPYQ